MIVTYKNTTKVITNIVNKSIKQLELKLEHAHVYTTNLSEKVILDEIKNKSPSDEVINESKEPRGDYPFIPTDACTISRPSKLCFIIIYEISSV